MSEMSKLEQVLIYSIQPEHVLNFLNGLKTIEVRKRDLPQWVKEALAQGEVVEGYGYCTKGGKRLLYEKQPRHPYYMLSNSDGPNSGNGKVVVKFQVSGSDVIHAHHLINQSTYWYTLGDNSDNTELIEKSCVDMGVMLKYLGLNDGYAHHFTNITPIEPMELREFMTVSKKPIIDKSYTFAKFYKPYMFADMIDGEAKLIYQLTKAPQSFMTTWVKGE